MGNIDNAYTELSKILTTLPNRINANKEYVEDKSKSFRNIDGKIFPRTNLENNNSQDILDIINETYPGFKDEFGSIFESINLENFERFFSTDAYTADEVKNVIDEWKTECALRSVDQDRISKNDILQTIIECNTEVTTPIVPYSREDLIKAACEKILEDTQFDQETVSIKNPDIEDIIQEDEEEPNYGNNELDTLLDSLRPAKNVIIIGNSTDKIKEILVNIGDEVSCETNLFKTENGVIPAGFDKATVKDIFVKPEDNIQNTELIHLEILSSSKLEKSFVESKDQIEEIQKAVNLKEQQFQAEKNWYFLRIKEAWASGRYEAYEYYFSRFSELLETRNSENEKLQELTAEISKVEKQINDMFKLFGDGTVIPPPTPQRKQELTNLISIRNEIFTGIQSTVAEINNANAQIAQLRNDQSYFAAETEDVLAEITSNSDFIDEGNLNSDSRGNPSPNGAFLANPIGRNRTRVQFFIPSTETVNFFPSSRSLAKGVQERIEEFTNELAIDGSLLRYMDNNDFSYSYNLSFVHLPLEIPDGDDGWLDTKVVSRQNKRDNIDGPFHNLREEFYLYVKNTPDFIKSKPEWNIDVKERENLLRITLDNKINNTVNRIKNYSKQYGHVAIKFDNAFLNVPESGRLDAYKIALDEIRAERQTAEDLVSLIRGGLESAEEKIIELENTLNHINESTCEYYKIYSTQLRDETEYRLCIWPQPVIESVDETLIDEEINYRGNPRSLNISPPITDIRWWRKFCNLATTINLVPIYWPVGLLIPTPSGLIKIPLPVIWKPLFVIPTPVALIVIGIAQAGVLPGPWVFVLNPNNFNLGPVNLNSAWFTGAVRPFKRIKNRPGSQILPVAPIVNIGLNSIDISPNITSMIPFIKDDLPPYERLSLNNILLLLFIDRWCRAGKRSQGFFTNP